MEIEKKYLIMEKDKAYSTKHLKKIFSSVSKLVYDVFMLGTPIEQGYLPIDEGLKLSEMLGMSVDFNPSEARLRKKGEKNYITFKDNGGLARNELEVEIEKEVFDKYWKKTKGQRVKKMRLEKAFEGYTAEIDVYTDRNLVVAEIEVPNILIAEKLKPLGKDITNDKEYKNRNLAK